MLVNLTPHDVNLFNEKDELYMTIPPTDPPARCEETFTGGYYNWGDYNGSSFSYKSGDLSYSTVYNLPTENHETKYIVSVLVAQQFPDRYDLLVPYDIVRKDGRIIGCKALARLVVN